ncbi:MAG: AAA family ATPase, partial [Clostridia bacterium]|nr:AAA family ATPase [Clostridia bacterium]
MLLELDIKNIALIDSLHIDFDRGLNALTGETGAGKSIVVDCVNLALGHRGGKDMLRTGESKASVKALFDIENIPNAKEFMDSAGIEFDDGFVEVSREINAAGRNSCRINGTMVPLSTLKEFASTLVDLHGQQEHQKLMSPANHVLYLDSFGGEEQRKALDDMKDAYELFANARRELEKLEKDERELALRQDILTMQYKEISAAKLKEDEEEDLIKRSKIFENSEKLSDSMRIAYERLYAGGKSLSAQDSVKKALDALRSVADLDPNYETLADKLEEILYNVKDIGYEVQSIYEDLSFDPAEAERVQDRLDLIKKLKRKYGTEVKDVIAHGKELQQELKKIENIDVSRAELEESCAA